MNKVILVGRVVYPPRFNTTDYGAVVNMKVKTTHRYKSNSGEIIEKSQVNGVALWGKLAELNQGVREGQLVSVEGRMQSKKVQDKIGKESWVTEVVANAFEILVGEQSPKAAGTGSFGEDRKPVPPPPADDFGDDDIPF